MIHLKRPTGPNAVRINTLYTYHQTMNQAGLDLPDSVADALAVVRRVEDVAAKTPNKREVQTKIAAAILKDGKIPATLRAEVASAEDVQLALQDAYDSALRDLDAAYRVAGDAIFDLWRPIAEERIERAHEVLALVASVKEHDTKELLRAGRRDVAEAVANLPDAVDAVVGTHRAATRPMGGRWQTGGFGTFEGPLVADRTPHASDVRAWATLYREGYRLTYRHPAEAERMKREADAARREAAAAKRPIGGAMGGRKTMHVFGAPVRG